MTLPRVSLLVAIRNESRYVRRCLTSIAMQDYPGEKLEVWILDGHSTDDSGRMVQDFIQGRPSWYLVENQGVTQSHGWNLGIQMASGEVVGIVSGHVELAPDYVSTAVETLERTGADLVGGPARKSGHGAVGKAIALATSTPFGVGGARFHLATREEAVDTVFMGVCRREVYERVGMFDVEMVRNQDDEFSYRLRKQGGRIICNPAIRSTYYPRDSLAKVVRQYFSYGYWKVRVMQKHPRQMKLRQFVPAAFVVSLALSAASSLVVERAWLVFVAISGLYVAANAAASVAVVRRWGWRQLLPVSLVFAALHFSYGFGFLAGLCGAIRRAVEKGMSGGHSKLWR